MEIDISTLWKQYLILLLYSLITSTKSSPEESQLYEDLLKDYNPYERPVAHSSENVTVSVGLALQQIVDVDEKNQEVEVNAWLKLSWYDYKLHWNPEDYGGITDVRFRKGQIWTPDILLYNSVAEEFDSLYPANVLVYSNGLITWIPPAIFALSAKIHIAWFPFDSQICQLKFGSWTYDGSRLELKLDENGFDLSSYIPNGEWEIKNVNAERHIQFYKCCIEPYFDIVFTFQIQRKTLFYGFNLIVPCIAITLLTIVGFAYPSEAGEKMSIQINVLFSIFIFQNYVTEMSPPTSESIPFLGTYFMFTIITVSMSVVGTVVIVNIHNRTVKTHHMTPTLMKLFLVKLPKILMMRTPRVRYIPKDYEIEAPEELKKPRETLKQLLSEQNMNIDMIPIKKLSQLLVLEKMLDDIKTVNELTRKEFDEELESYDWRYISIVFDRIALLICAAFVSLCTIILFCSAAFDTIMAAFWLISLLLGVTVVQFLSAGPLEIAASSALNPTVSPEDPIVIPDNDGMTDQICGTHPLKTIVKKIEHSQPDMDQQSVVRLLALMRLRAPKLWNSYQQMLAAYMNCKVMSAGGSLG